MKKYVRLLVAGVLTFGTLHTSVQPVTINNSTVNKKNVEVLTEVKAEQIPKDIEVPKTVVISTQKEIKKPVAIISEEAVSLFNKHSIETNDNVVFHNNDYSITVKRGDKELLISQADLKEMFKIIYYEANVEPYNGKVAVVNIILNRAFSRGMSVTDVIYAKSQFSPVGEGKMEQDTYNEECVKAVFEGLSNKVVGDSVEYFCEPKLAKSKWMIKERKFVTTIGNHSFFK